MTGKGCNGCGKVHATVDGTGMCAACRMKRFFNTTEERLRDRADREERDLE